MGVLILMNHCSAHYASGAEHHGIALGDIYSADMASYCVPSFGTLKSIISRLGGNDLTS